MNLYVLIKPLGIATYSVVLLTIISGLLRWKIKTHKTLAFTAIALASIHAAIILFF